MTAESPGIADQSPYVVPGLEQKREEGPADRSARPGKQDHAGALYPGTPTPYNVRSGRPGNPAGTETWTIPRGAKKGSRHLAYVIAEPCIGQKDNSCVEVCPVDCIHPTPDEPDYEAVEQLYIDPDECIDCDACVEACPVDACFAEDQLPEEWAKYTPINAEYYSK
jgi:NAD-dependent dihydropyrimidine dehydrogenase PreA subunit